MSFGLLVELNHTLVFSLFPDLLTVSSVESSLCGWEVFMEVMQHFHFNFFQCLNVVCRFIFLQSLCVNRLFKHVSNSPLKGLEESVEVKVLHPNPLKSFDSFPTRLIADCSCDVTVMSL